MKKYKTIFADLDGTLIDTVSGSTFQKGIWDMKFKFDVLDKIKAMNPELILIVSNQGGIEKGYVDEGDFCIKAKYITCAIAKYCNVKAVRMQVCTSNDKDDKNRKPNTGMLEFLYQRSMGSNWEQMKGECLMIGDASGKEGQFSDSDKKCAENFGIDYLDVEDFVHIQ